MAATRQPAGPPLKALEILRQGIDRADRTILQKLAERARLVQNIGRPKRNSGMAFHQPDRERQVIDRLLRDNQGPFPHQAIEAIFREIMGASLNLENPLTVAVDELSERAARARFGRSARIVRQEKPAAIVDAVARGEAGFGVLVVEDARTGFQGAALDALLDGGVPLTGEVLLHHQGDSVRALVVGGEEQAPTGDDQTTLVFIPRDEPGAVARVLATFAKAKVNLRRVESRPLRAGPKPPNARWEYRFVADLEGHRAERPLKSAFAALARGGALVSVLGSYPRARGFGGPRAKTSRITP